MSKKRRNHEPSFKAKKVTLAAIRGDKNDQRDRQPVWRTSEPGE